MKSWRARVITVAVSVLALCAFVVAPAQAHGRTHRPAAHPATTTRYYLSLGDSLAFGYQPNLVAEHDKNLRDYRSFAEDYATLHPRLRLVNYGCPGETTTTMVQGGCPWPAADLHNGYGGASSQLGAAQAFLTAHPGQVRLVTIAIGNNDLLGLVEGCEASAPSNVDACIAAGLPATLATLSANYTRILQVVRQYAPQARVVLFNMYNPLAISLASSDQLVALINQGLATLAATAGAQVADAFGAINVRAGSGVEKLAVCALTWECTSYANVHPNTLGYWSLTFALERAVW